MKILNIVSLILKAELASSILVFNYYDYNNIIIVISLMIQTWV